MTAPFTERRYADSIPTTGIFFLSGDIGGTNTNFGIFDVTDPKKPQLLMSLHTKSATIDDFTAVVADLMALLRTKFSITPTLGCIGVAGVVSDNRLFGKPTNLSISVDGRTLRTATNIDSLILINDFEAVSLGIDFIDPQSIITINKGTKKERGQKGFLGAGTGLGKSALLWNSKFKRYLPFASEGGHADASAQSAEDLALFEFIKKHENYDCPISWEIILSGSGLQRIYKCLGSVKQYSETPVRAEIENDRFNPDKISKYAQTDEQCGDAFVIYARWYARCAKNFVLDVLAVNGMYIAGGIAAKNVSVFRHPVFMEEFVSCGKHRALLENVPVFVIADYNINLYGSYGFFVLHSEGIL